jgi:molybdate transport system ATP-binding protein
MGLDQRDRATAITKTASAAQKERTLPEQSCAALHARIQKRFPNTRAFQLQVEFSAEPGITVFFGASGAGKTTILDCLAGLLSPDAGRVALGQHVLFDSTAGINVPVPKRGVGYVFQDLALFPHLTVQANVEYGLKKLNSVQRRDRAVPLLEAFRIIHLAGRRPNEISGGERQRVALARSIVTNPTLLLLDEPLAGLDAPVKSSILDDLRAWNAVYRIPILYVTHSREEVLALGDAVIVLEKGRIVAQGTPHQVLTVPRQETIAQLVGFENIFDATVEAIHEDRGTMACRLAPNVLLETPLVHAEIGSKLRIGIRAGDILLATRLAGELSARNILPGKLVSLSRRDVIIDARVNCGVEFEVELTLAARDALQLVPGKEVWLVVKTHSCHLMAS